jgi:DtxR family Mn-dependent transcriptional regulator
MESKTLCSSLENYLEAIYHLVENKQLARVKNISKRLKVNYSSVTGALKVLAARKLINYAPYSPVTLTPKGKEIAKDMIVRHEILFDFFANILHVDEKQANKAACEMEHSLSPEILKRFQIFFEAVKTCNSLNIPFGDFERVTSPAT